MSPLPSVIQRKNPMSNASKTCTFGSGTPDVYLYNRYNCIRLLLHRASVFLGVVCTFSAFGIRRFFLQPWHFPSIFCHSTKNPMSDEQDECYVS